MTATNTSGLNSVNQSIPEGCLKIRFSDMEFLPWNNPDNIVSEEVEVYTRKVRFVTLQVLFLIGGPANIINMAVFYKQSLKDRVNLLLFSLSLADEIFLLMALLNYAEEFYLQMAGETKAGPLLTFIVNNHLNGFQGCCFVSFALSAIIACERCYCVLRPLKYKTLMRTRTMVFVIIAVYALVLGIGFIVVFRYYFGCIYDPDIGVPMYILAHSEFYTQYKDLIDYLDIVFLGGGVPVGMMIVVTTTTAITTTKLRQVVAWRSETSSSLSPREVALTKMLIGSSLLLIICIFPACLFRVACLIVPEINTGRRHQNFYLMCLWTTEIFMYVNSSMNIFIYYVMGSKYRETFWALMKRKTVAEEK
ncbi:hypothetical protein ACOMHN_012530 [Nucella lapillus]